MAERTGEFFIVPDEQAEPAGRVVAREAFLRQNRIDVGVEHRREIAGRGVDDLQHLGGRGLLLQRLARLSQEPRVFHCDDRLRREVLQQRYLLISERADFRTKCRDVTK